MTHIVLNGGHMNRTNRLTSEEVKQKAIALGCDLCGIASIDRFIGLPEGTNPMELLPEARTVIVVAKKFLMSTTSAKSTIPYTIIRNSLSRALDDITIQLSYLIEEGGFLAIPTGAIEPCNYNKELKKTVGLISLKYAARQAGLGTIGKNTLLITPEYGNMIWLGAIITSLELSPDTVMDRSACGENCRLCIDACPVQAIDGSEFIDQKKCWNFAFGKEGDGEWRIKCNKCRTICPHAKGIEAKKELANP